MRGTFCMPWLCRDSLSEVQKSRQSSSPRFGNRGGKSVTTQMRIASERYGRCSLTNDPQLGKPERTPFHANLELRRSLAELSASSFSFRSLVPLSTASEITYTGHLLACTSTGLASRRTLPYRHHPDSHRVRARPTALSRSNSSHPSGLTTGDLCTGLP